MERDYEGYVGVCVSTTNELHWPDELCSPQKMDFAEMTGSKPGD